MPSKTGSGAGDGTTREKTTTSFVDDYLADWGDDDPFRSPSPEPAKSGANVNEKKKDTLGIDKELDLKKKARVPRVKLDETRRLLSFYQEWLDDLFPKATFLDALAMVEKTGHKTTMRSARLKWIDESKPRAAAEEEEEEHLIHQGSTVPRQPDRIAPIFEKSTQERAKTPTADDLFGDDDIYNATPRQNTSSTAPGRQVVSDDVPDEDDLDALMAEAESGPGDRTQPSGPASVPYRSIFGDGIRRMAPAPAPAPRAEPDDDDLEALMAEAEAQSRSRPGQLAPQGSTSAGSGSNQQTVEVEPNDDDLDALMAEAEAQAPTLVQPAAKNPDVDEDDLDALMAEAEAGASANPRPSIDAKTGSSTKMDDQQTAGFEDDEEAMAEMDGLW
ncbi:chromosome segregation in meiosis- protein [Collariella sp. IMI 366227]|nr:chromosome segregation in meiosis- protein [Collariella sp. IMI 366227]